MILLKVSLFNSSSALFRFFQPSLLKTCHMRYKLVLKDRFLANPRTDRELREENMTKLLFSISTLLSIVRNVIGVILVVWSIYIAFKVLGLVAAIITFFFPVLGQLYWGWRSYRIDGFDSDYVKLLIIFLIVVVVQFVMFLLTHRTSNDR